MMMTMTMMEATTIWKIYIPGFGRGQVCMIYLGYIDRYCGTCAYMHTYTG